MLSDAKNGSEKCYAQANAKSLSRLLPPKKKLLFFLVWKRKMK